VPQHQAMIDHGVVAGDRASHLTSVQYQMAVAALQPATAIDLNPSSGGLSLELQSFMARIKAEGDAALLQFYPDAWPARLAVATRSGTHERTVINVPGDPSLPFDWIAIAEKFRRVVAPMLGGDEADHLARRIVDCLQQGRSLTWLVDEVDRICRAAISAG